MRDIRFRYNRQHMIHALRVLRLFIRSSSHHGEKHTNPQALHPRNKQDSESLQVDQRAWFTNGSADYLALNRVEVCRKTVTWAETNHCVAPEEIEAVDQLLITRFSDS